MVTIESIGYAMGYTGADHLLDDAPLQGLIGTEYRSVADAQRASQVVERRSPPDRRVRTAPIEMTVRLASGMTRLVR